MTISRAKFVSLQISTCFENRRRALQFRAPSFYCIASRWAGWKWLLRLRTNLNIIGILVWFRWQCEVSQAASLPFPDASFLKEYTSQIHHSYKEASCQHIQSTTQLPWFDCSVSWLDAWSLSRLAISQVLCCNRARHLKSNDMLLTVRQQCFHAFCKTS